MEVAGRSLPLTPHFFQLYCLLAYHRAAGHDRFLTVPEVHRLPRWNRAGLESIGKSIHRHVARMRRAGWDLIESPARATTKLFRLKAAAEDIAFDVLEAEVRAYLGLDLVIRQASRVEVDRVFRFSWALARARLDLEEGNLPAAGSLLDEAERVPDRGPRERIDLLLLRSRVLECEGRLQEALACAQAAFALTRQQGVDYLTQARARIRLGFLHVILRWPERYPEARAHYLEALRLLDGHAHCAELSQVATGLGHLARREGDYDAAHAHFLRALEYATVDGWAWGTQAAYFNLELAQAERGDRLRDPQAARAAYLDAARWLRLSYDFVQRTGMRYTSEGQTVLAHVYLKLGRARSALVWATRAREVAETAGNRKAQAVALAVLGECQQAVGARAEALASFRAAQTIYRDIGIEAEAARIGGLIARLRTQGPSRSPSPTRSATPVG